MDDSHPQRRDAHVEDAYRFVDLAEYPLRQRLLIRLLGLIFFLLIYLVARTIRFQVEGWHHHEKATEDGGVPIYTFWHDQLFLAPFFWRRRGIVVMVSRSYDGEYIARCLQRFGCGVVRGSSSRGGAEALIKLAGLVRAGRAAAFTIDGPKGPRCVAKVGAVLLSKKTGRPVLPFSIEPARYWQAGSWDRLKVPRPFTRARVRIGAPLWVAREAGAKELEAARGELQGVLSSLSA